MKPNKEIPGKMSVPGKMNTLEKKSTPEINALEKKGTPVLGTLEKKNTPEVSALEKKSTPEVSALKKKGTPEVSALEKKGTPVISALEKKDTPVISILEKKNTPEMNIPVKNQPEKRTLYVTDLDGTLLNTQDKISPTSLSIINSLIDRGMHFTYATARSLVSAKKVTQGLRLDIPVIVYNGAFIMNARDESILYSCSFTEEERLYVKELLEEYNAHPLIYTFEEGIERVFWHREFENDGMKRYLACRSGDRRFRPLKSSENLYRGDIFYYTCIGEEEEFLPVFHKLQEDGRYTCTLKQELYRPEYWLEIMPKKATKAEAIRKLQELWECDRIISFGDAVNDIPMFLYSDEAYAVANAVPECKECAADVIGGNDEDGVALWLQEHLNDNMAL